MRLASFYTPMDKWVTARLDYYTAYTSITQNAVSKGDTFSNYRGFYGNITL